jgi:hypothetical protein
MVISSETVNVPSQFEQPNLEEILADTNIRTAYNNTVKLYKRLTHLSTTSIFLKICQKENIIPPTHKIGLKLPRFNGPEEIKAQNILQQASKNLIKISIQSLEIQEKEEFTKPSQLNPHTIKQN